MYPGRKTIGTALGADGGTHWLGAVIPSMIMKQGVWLTVTFWVSLQTSVAQIVLRILITVEEGLGAGFYLSHSVWQTAA